RVGLEESKYEPTTYTESIPESVRWGTAVSRENATFYSSGTIEMKLAMKNGTVALTVASRPFFSTPDALTIRNNYLKERAKRFIIATAISRTVSTLARTRPIAWCLNKVTDCSPLNKLVYLGRNQEPVCLC